MNNIEPKLGRLASRYTKTEGSEGRIIEDLFDRKNNDSAANIAIESAAEIILEALFTGADEAEIKRRDAAAPKIMRDEWMEEFLKRKDIKKLPDDFYDVDGDVKLSDLKLQKLPLKFNKVGGYFWCYYNQLTSLEGAPMTVGRGFSCSNNQLTSLKGAPKTVGGYFLCSYNKLTTLEGAPKTVGGYFWCSYNKKKFTKDEVRAVSDVKGEIYV